MSRQWMTCLMAILLVYIPVAIDATVLHVAAPTSVALGSSGNELLWIIDIYSLVMAGMVLPMAPLAIRSALSACCCSAAPFLASPRCAPRCRRRP